MRKLLNCDLLAQSNREKKMDFWMGFTVLILPFVLVVSCSVSHSTRAVPVNQAAIQAFFSLRGGNTDAFVDAIGKAKSEVLVQAYSFTSEPVAKSLPIAKALVEAHKRGVHVEIILDKSQRSERYSSADFTAHAGIPTFIDTVDAITHNKVMIIDETMVITGSFNLAEAAKERNADGLLITNSKALSQKYIENWEKHKGHSEKYEGRQGAFVKVFL